MTDRDHFAAAALTGLLADDGDRTEHGMPSFSARAYQWADAMLRERGTAVSDNCVSGNQPEIACLTEPDKVMRTVDGIWRFWKYDNVPPAPASRPAETMADQRLRERGTKPMPEEKRAEVSAAPVSRPSETRKTNHDAVPAAKAPTDASPLPGSTPVTAGMGTGNTQEPVSWARYDAEGGFRNLYTPDEYDGACIAWQNWGCTFVPLYRHPQPALTAEEREAIEYFASFQWTMLKPYAATLRSLLDRTQTAGK